MNKLRILHVSTAHPPNDPRLAYRVIPSLAPVYELIAALPNAPVRGSNGVRYIRLPLRRHVLARLCISHPLVLWHALRLRPSLLHIYDPELIPIARFIQLWLRISIIYEVHENFYKKMVVKTLNRGALLEWAFRWFDRLARRHFYLIFTEHAYLDTYTSLNKPSAIVYNFPRLALLDNYRRPYSPSVTAPHLFYIGRISIERAFDTLVSGLAILKNRYPNIRLHLFGERTFNDNELAKLPGFAAVRDNLIFHGYTDHGRAFPYAVGATAGLALLKPIGDYPDSYTTKLFEYMALGLPVVTSDFTLYREVVERHQCGFCVSPYDPVQVAEALTYLIEHPEEARKMGLRGRNAVETHYNWNSEADKLLTFYKLVLTENESDSIAKT